MAQPSWPQAVTWRGVPPETATSQICQWSVEYCFPDNNTVFASKETLASADALRVKLANNPYVKVKGFRVGVPPNFSFDFEFRE